MIYVPRRNIYTPRPIWGRKYFQKGIIQATAVYGAGAPEVVSLSGTALAPVTRSGSQFDPPDSVANITWYFSGVTTPGQSIEKGETQSASYATELAQYTSQNATTDWVIPHQYIEAYWIRATFESGDSPTSGSALDTWLTLASGQAQFWTWTDTTIPGGPVAGIVKIDISDDSSGSPILDTGFYEGSARLESGL